MRTGACLVVELSCCRVSCNECAIPRRATFNVEHGFTDAFEAAWGFPFAGTGYQGGLAKAWVDDVISLFRSLRIVANNSPQAIGGGGVPAQPPPPPFCD